MSAEESFESAEYLASFALDEIEQLDACIKAAYGDQAAVMVTEFNPKHRDYEIIFRHDPPPARARGLASNVIKNLKDALDQATFAASLHISERNPKRLDRCHFPFGTSPDDLDIAMTRGRCSAIPEELYPAIRSYQPYPTGNNYAGGNNYLKLLSKIAGSHKHRTALTVKAKMGPHDIRIRRIDLSEGGTFTVLPTRKPRSEYDFIAVIVTGSGNMDIDADTYSYVAFSHPDLADIPATHFLRECQATVAHIVQDLKAQAFKLKPGS